MKIEFDVKFWYAILLHSILLDTYDFVSISEYTRLTNEREQEYLERIECKFCPDNCSQLNARGFGVGLGYGSPSCGYCEPCVTDDLCTVYGDCCVNRLPNNSDKVGTCVPSNYKKPYSGDGYKAISKCHPAFNKQYYETKCEKSDPDSQDEDVLSPVTSENHMVFRNKYCAICNNVTRYQQWDMSIVCETEFSISLSKSRHEVMDMLWNNQYCKLGPLTPQSDPPVATRECYAYDPSSIITKCNVTGFWETYDEAIERACRLYKRVFIRRYQNVFCFLCNTPDLLIDEECRDTGLRPAPSFSDILNFRLEEDIGDKSDRLECSRGYRFDKKSNKCREIYCAPGRWYTNSKCDKVINTEEIIEFKKETAFRIQPTITTGACSGQPFPFRELAGELKNHIGTHFDLVYQKSVLTSGVVETKIKRCSSNLSIVHDDSRIDRDTMMEESTIHGYTATIIYTMANGMATEQLRGYVMNSSGHIYHSNLSGIGHIIFVEDKQLFIRLLDQTNNSTLEILANEDSYAPFELPSRYVELSRLIFCPYIILQNNEYQLNANRTAISFPGVNDEVEQDGFEVQRDSTVHVCAEEYFNLMEKQDIDSESEYTAEVILSLICTCISVLCLATTFVIHCLLKTLRSLPGLNNMGLTLTLMIAQLFFQFGSYATSNVVLCEIMGGITHYIWLAAVLWMNVCSLHMFRVFFLDTFRKSGHAMKVFVLYGLYCFCIPLIFVAINIAVTRSHSIGTVGTFGYSGRLCFINDKLLLGLLFALPVGVIILSNIVMFILSVCSFYRQAREGSFAGADRQYIHVYFRLSTLTGMAWIFGFIYQWTAVEVFSYLFIIFSGAQGLFIFIALICNRNVFGRMKSRKRSKTKYTPVFTKSTSGTATTILTTTPG